MTTRRALTVILHPDRPYTGRTVRRARATVARRWARDDQRVNPESWARPGASQGHSVRLLPDAE